MCEGGLTRPHKRVGMVVVGFVGFHDRRIPSVLPMLVSGIVGDLTEVESTQLSTVV